MPLSKIDSDSLTAPLTVPAGSAAAPAITTTGDTNTGIFFPAADTVATSVAGTEGTRLTSTGLGIGTSSPGAKLSVTKASNYDVARLTAPDLPTLDLYQSAQSNASARNWRVLTNYEGWGTLDIQVGTTSADAPSVTRLSLAASGMLGIGTTSASASRLSISGTATLCMLKNESATDGTARTTILFRDNGDNTRGTITVSTSGTVYNTTSDYRLKENIAPMTGALDKVALLKPVTYTWKETGDSGQGFIAHELQAVVPECVTGEKDAVEQRDDKEFIVPQGIDTSFLVATLTAAIQELKAIVDAQGAEIAALKGTP